MPGSRRPHDLPGTLVAAGFAALGVGLMSGTGGMTPMGSVFPITISAAMIALSGALIALNVVRGLRSTPDGTESPPPGSNPRRAAFLVAMAAWIALLPVAGFLAASALGYFAVMAIALHERVPLRRAALLVLIGLAILAGFYALMAEVLLIPLPRGVLF